MVTISFTVSDSHAERLANAFCGLHNYEQESHEEETRAQFSKRILRGWLVAQVRRWEQLEAQKVAASELTEIDVV